MTYFVFVFTVLSLLSTAGRAFEIVEAERNEREPHKNAYSVMVIQAILTCWGIALLIQ